MITIRVVASILLLLMPLTPMAEDKASESSTAEESTIPLSEIRLFSHIFDHIRQHYVDPISDKELLENAIKGMLNEMDPHSAYLDEDSFSDLNQSIKGEFGGVGIEMSREKGVIRVIAPVDDSPAEKAGVQAGDLIIKVDQKSIQDLPIHEVSEKIKGPIDTDVIFTIVREGVKKPFDITVVRGVIQSVSVRHRIFDNNIGYIRIALFQKNTSKEFSRAIEKLDISGNQLIGIIIDLRNNPGGALKASVDVVDSLIGNGMIVSTKGRHYQSNSEYHAKPGDETDGLPIVVLVNGGSASASEIVAGALQDQQRAVIMGTRTFGKGSVQKTLPVAKNKGIKLTTSRYLTPKGRSIQAQGITPDIIVKPATITAIETGARFGEANLSNHLKSTNDEKEIDTDKASDNNDANTEDNQLFEAINLLKGLAIFNQHKKS